MAGAVVYAAHRLTPAGRYVFASVDRMGTNQVRYVRLDTSTGVGVQCYTITVREVQQTCGDLSNAR